MISIKNLRKEYENAIPLKDVNAVINDGDIISVIGPSGTGKSTLIRCINMLDEATSGEIIVDGENILSLTAAKTKSAKRWAWFSSRLIFSDI